MNESATSPATVDYVSLSFEAIEAGDMDLFRTCFAPGATVWHNVDDLDQDIDTVCAILGGLCQSATRIRYVDRRSLHPASDIIVTQHVLTASLKSGREMRMPAMMRIEVAGDGRIAHIEEYYDSRHADCLIE